MGMPVVDLPDQTASAEPEAAEEGEEEESVVHQTASLGDVEVRLLPTSLNVHIIMYCLRNQVEQAQVFCHFLTLYPLFKICLVELFIGFYLLIPLGFEKCFGIWW